ncbi:MAG: type II secretion system secretin GspD [Proteobacteria bacterium]|nr:type II secretion system secretin GspD [Pseudomonadota bacterium]MBU1709078.1 type II secretion system secretin GspD [Pseudomonadota bacterium]
MERMKFLLVTMLLVVFLSPGGVHAAEPAADEEMIFNFHDVDIRTIIKSVAKITGKNFILDPGVKGKVTIVSSQAMSADEVYGVFLSILQVHNFSAIEAGQIVKIIPHDQAKQDNSPIINEGETLESDKFITFLHRLEFVESDKLVPILRPLMNPKSYLAAHQDSNTIIISDNAANVKRLVEIITKIDQGKTAELEVVKLQHADARDVVSVVEGLDVKAQKGNAEAQQIRLIADERTNSILLSGAERLILRAKVLIAHLDTPVATEGDTQVVFLRYAQAKDLMPILSGMKTEQQGGQPNVKGAARGGRADVIIQADEATNSLIITAQQTAMKTLLSIVHKLDIRRPQVLIEAVVAEVTTGKTADLGVQWRSTAGTDGSGFIGGTDFTNPNPNNPGSGINSLAVNPLGLSGGFNLGFFNGTTTIFGTEILNLGGLISALSSDGDTNILSTPTLVTLDNQEAEIIVGENVPFATGSYTSTGNNNPQNPFTTYERKDVGVKLKIKPQINEGNTVRLELEQEVSKVIQSAASTGLQSTDTRSIKTTVIVEDGKILVLGGLISDDVQENVVKVPLLGDIPFIGALFRYSYSKHEKKNLMVFLRPVILKDEETSSRITFDRYDYMRRRQQEFQEDGVNLMPGEVVPVLPELEGSAHHTDDQLLEESGQNVDAQ